MLGRHRARPLHRAPKSLPSRRRALRNADRRLMRVFGTWREQHWYEILQRNQFVAAQEFIRRRSVSKELQTRSAKVQLSSPNLRPGETQGVPTRGSPTTIAWDRWRTWPAKNGKMPTGKPGSPGARNSQAWLLVCGLSSWAAANTRGRPASSNETTDPRSWTRVQCRR